MEKKSPTFTKVDLFFNFTNHTTLKIDILGERFLAFLHFFLSSHWLILPALILIIAEPQLTWTFETDTRLNSATPWKLCWFPEISKHIFNLSVCAQILV